MYIITKVRGSNKWYVHHKDNKHPVCNPVNKKRALHIAADATGLSYKDYMKLYRKEK